jgi:RHS repeat-associated protein
MCFGLSPFGGTGRGLWYSFDAWGRRRSANDWNYTLDAADQPLFAGRGFTGHEHLPEFGLINMNGRLYDPLLGRFLSPDNNVQMPDFSQNFNRYSYALNNPLVYVDPDGENPLAFIIGAIIGAYLGGTATNDWQWNPGKWDYENPATYFGIVGGGLAGGLGAQWMLGPEGVLAGGTPLNVSLGINFDKVGTAFANISIGGGSGVTLETLGYATVAGGGAYLTGTMINNWMDGQKTPNATDVINYEIAQTQQDYGSAWKAASFDNLFPQKGDQVLEPLHGFWDYSSYYLFGRSYGMYSVNADGRVIGLQPITGIAPTPGFAKGTKIIQYGGHTLSKNTLNTLNISKEQGKYAIESMKKANRLPADFHGNIGSDGSYWSKTWEYIDNILHYLY